MRGRFVMSDAILSKLPMSLQTLPERFDEEKLLTRAPTFSLGVLSAVPDAIVRDPNAFRHLHRDAVLRYRKEIIETPKLCALIEKYATEESFIKQLTFLSPVIALRDTYLSKLDRQIVQIALARKLLFEKTGEVVSRPPEPPFSAKNIPENLFHLDTEIFPEALLGLFNGVSDPAKAELTRSIPLHELAEHDEMSVATEIYDEHDAMYRKRIAPLIRLHEKKIADLNKKLADAEAAIKERLAEADILHVKLDDIAWFEEEIEKIKEAFPETMRDEVGRRAMSAAMNEQKIIRLPAPSDLKERSVLLLKTMEIRKRKDAFNLVLRKIFGTDMKMLLAHKKQIQADYETADNLLNQKQNDKKDCDYALQEEKSTYAAEVFAVKKEFNAALKGRWAMLFAARSLNPPEEAAAKIKLPPVLNVRYLSGEVMVEHPVSVPDIGMNKAAEILTSAGIPTNPSWDYLNPNKWNLLKDEDGGARLISPALDAEKAPEQIAKALKILRDSCGSIIASPVTPVLMTTLLPPVNATKSLTSVRDQAIAANINNDKETLRLVGMTAEQVRDEIIEKEHEHALSYEDFMKVTAGCLYRKTDFLASNGNAAYISVPLGRVPLSLSVDSFIPPAGEKAFIAVFEADPKNAFMPTGNGRYGVFASTYLTTFRSFWVIDDKGFTELKPDSNVKSAAMDSFAPTEQYFLSRFPKWQ